jgi:putative redox protein
MKDDMKANARRTGTFTHEIDVRGHQIIADEPAEHGGEDDGPSAQELLAASLAVCTATTIEMYARRKGWEIGKIAVEAEYSPTRFRLTLKLPANLTEEQLERLSVIAAKCPVHRTLDGEVMFDERIELVA